MSNVKYFESIQAMAPDINILFRMGYKSGITQVPAEQKEQINSWIRAARNLCTVRGAYTVIKIKKTDNDTVELDNGMKLKSGQLSALLMNSKEALIMAATCGATPVAEAQKEMAQGKPAYAIVIDAVASETADAGLDWIQDFVSAIEQKQGRKLTRRFSPGYGGLDLSAQKLLHSVLQLENIGIQITDKFILIPEKSVIAIAGVEG
jgi:hypothetical protein